MTLRAEPLSEKHLAELQLATERALQQWAKNVFAPQVILQSMERVLLFLRRNPGASAQARQVSSLAFIVGEQVVQLGGWRWMSVSEDGSVNPAIVSPDGSKAVLMVDVATEWVLGKGSISSLVRACLEGGEHEHVVTL